MTEQEFEELAAGHALGALSAEDERIFDAALSEHPEWEAHVVANALVVARLADSVADVAPPPALKQAIFAQLDAPPVQTVAEPPAPAPAAAAPARANRGLRMWFALAASVALLLGVGAGGALLVQYLNRPAAVVALERIESAPDAQQASAEVEGGGDATLHWSVELDEAVLVSDGLPEIASDQTFELWYVRGDTPISAGTFDPSRGSTSALLDPGLQAGDVVAVTVEPAGGSPDGSPSSVPIVTIATA